MTITGTTILVSYLHCNSFEDCAPVDFIYRGQVVKWVAETWLQDIVQWNLSVTTTSIIRFIACDLFSNVF